MKLKNIRLTNFGCVKTFNKEFENPLLILSGNNGHGKSTILKAILLAVFDTYTGVLSDYIKWGEKSFEVNVTFTHKGTTYESSVFYDGSTERSIKFDGKTFTGEESKKKLKEVLDIELLKASMLALEQQIDIVATKPAERREFLKRIYDLEFKSQLAGLSTEIKDNEV
ncbi:MAG: AAA family ATPase, partial [Phocaeicola sp.]